MAEIILSQDDRDRLVEVLKDTPCPKGLRRGTWHRLVVHGELDLLQMGELRSLCFAQPKVIDVLGLPIKITKGIKSPKSQAPPRTRIKAGPQEPPAKEARAKARKE
jgi:hypothetical protein